jgi:hypothetical protein
MFDLKKLFGRKSVFNSIAYWENRYAVGGNSGEGSYGKLCEFKADFINNFINKHHIKSAIEFGCGDGNQLSCIKYPKYLGLDVSSSTVRRCAELFKGDPSKSFFQYQPDAFINNGFIQADVSLSLDVIYHIVEKSGYDKYLSDVFNSATRFVIIYSTNFYKEETSHVLHREFLKDVTERFTQWKLVEEINNPYPETSMANFYIFQKQL